MIDNDRVAALQKALDAAIVAHGEGCPNIVVAALHAEVAVLTLAVIDVYKGESESTRLLLAERMIEYAHFTLIQTIRACGLIVPPEEMATVMAKATGSGIVEVSR